MSVLTIFNFITKFSRINQILQEHEHVNKLTLELKYFIFLILSTYNRTFCFKAFKRMAKCGPARIWPLIKFIVNQGQLPPSKLIIQVLQRWTESSRARYMAVRSRHTKDKNFRYTWVKLIETIRERRSNRPSAY